MPTQDQTEFALMTVEIHDALPSVETAIERLGVALEDIDIKFGILAIDASRGLYSIRVRGDRLPKGSGNQESYQGPFSDPTIAPLGPIDPPRPD
jgi:hypothetical protein